ncbi:synaptogenesis protein syg-2 [Microplitis demolitor]|uniref:synaptogenesis protein syg-2 n=1 Tax=Microplitis demolitor TaxID=69319 RepID=UPI00235B698C|nr:synaptogenesis protein syg-2 [Microplitis demolitor]
MHLTLSFVFFMSLLMLTYCLVKGNGVPDFANKGTPTKLVWAEEDDDVELPCDLTPPTPMDSVIMVLWFKDDVGIPLYSLDARTKGMNDAIHWAASDDLGNRTHFFTGNGHHARLKVKAVKFEDQGIFRCRVDFSNSPTRNFRVNLTLVEQPTRPIIYDAQGREVMGVPRFFEGYDLRLTCQVSGGRPKPTVTWWKDGQLLDGVVDVPEISEISGTSSKFTVNHLFIGKVTRSLWGSKLECRAQSGPMDKPIVREVPLDIYLKPLAVKIHLHDDLILVGQPIAAKCESWGSWPAATLTWSLGGLKFRDPVVASTQRSNSTLSKLALVLDREDDGKELSCTAVNHNFPGGELKESRVLRVAYAPIVDTQLAVGYTLESLREGDDLKLVCHVQSNPPPTEIIWFHNDTRLEHDVARGILIAANTLTLRILTLQYSGEYSCFAKNNVGESRSLPIFIYMKYAPRCKVGFEYNNVVALLDETVKLRCEVEATPIDGVRFSWTFNGTKGDVLPIQNSRPRNHERTSTLEYTPLIDSDYGTLGCWASNSVGRQRTPCIFNIVPAKVPQSPIDCTLHNESSALEVNCIPGSDGGLPQHFLLEVRGSMVETQLLQTSQTLQTPQSDQGKIGEAPPIYRTENLRPTFQLNDLEPGYDYTLAVYAINKHGRSQPKLFRNVRIYGSDAGRNMEVSGEFVIDNVQNIIPRSNLENFFITVGVIGAAAAILIGIGIIIGVIICRKRVHTPRVEYIEDLTTPTYVSAQRIEPRVKYGSDRRRSQRTSLYMEESKNDPDLLPQVEIDLHR